MNQSVISTKLHEFVFDDIAYAMHQNIQLSMLLPLVTTLSEGDLLSLSYDVSHRRGLSLKNYISDHKMDSKKVIRILESIITLESILEQYMLTPAGLIFDESFIFLNPEDNLVSWAYMPIETKGISWKANLLRIIRGCLIESFDTPDVNRLIPYLLESSFSPEILLKALKGTESIKSTPTTQPKPSVGFNSSLVKDFITSKTRQKKPEAITKPIKLTSRTSYIKRCPLLISRSDPSLQYSLYYDEVLIGREENCDVLLNHPSVSREHARICHVGTRYFLEDLSSTNGTKINSCLLEDRTEIHHGEVIQIGDCEFVFLI